MGGTATKGTFAEEDESGDGAAEVEETETNATGTDGLTEDGTVDGNVAEEDENVGTAVADTAVGDAAGGDADFEDTCTGDTCVVATWVEGFSTVAASGAGLPTGTTTEAGTGCDVESSAVAREVADDSGAEEDETDEDWTTDSGAVVSEVVTGMPAGSTSVLGGRRDVVWTSAVVSTLDVSAVSAVAFLTFPERYGNSCLDMDTASFCMSYASP